jgi:serine/threonine protein kinase
MQYSVGQLLDGRYSLTRFIGSGSFGEVWVAVDKATDLEVAIKIYLSMDPKGLSDFKKEFKVSFNLNHTNLLHANYLGTTTEDNRAYLVMPLCPDGSASKYIGKADEFVLWKFIKDVASGLAYLHEQTPPVIHQDIKPDNILISKGGDFLITDFGISKQLKNTLKKSAGNLNSAGSISYMGPERFSKQSLPIKASDIWSLGVTVYEMAVGELPFCGMGGSMQKKGADIPELPDTYSDTLNMVMMSCLALEPWSRPTARQLEDFAARHLAGDSPQMTWAAPAAPQVQPQPSFRQTVAVAEPVAAVPQYQDSRLKRTVAVGQMPQMEVPHTVPSYTPAQPEPRKSISAIFWVLAVVAGLATGVLLNIFM